MTTLTSAVSTVAEENARILHGDIYVHIPCHNLHTRHLHALPILTNLHLRIKLKIKSGLIGGIFGGILLLAAFVDVEFVVWTRYRRRKEELDMISRVTLAFPRPMTASSASFLQSSRGHGHPDDGPSRLEVGYAASGKERECECE
ncbi:hypothetical protein BD410DRAFT_548836 [Rickenella mellea]|uniref:Uncharacterized protein n=1 Tax=Rickenella mellea TaxID=50990 RepID=A0A4Y7PQL8_9AGAM|nr:hypothetical protein BD410DRAFT_548836 [Rickenella mellea]